MLSFQELCKKYKKEICSYCINNNPDDCNIRKTLEGIKCINYKKRPEIGKSGRLRRIYEI